MAKRNVLKVIPGSAPEFLLLSEKSYKVGLNTSAYLIFIFLPICNYFIVSKYKPTSSIIFITLQ